MPRCLEVALKESPISPAIPPTVSCLFDLRYFKMANRRRLAKAFKTFSRSFMALLYHILLFARISLVKSGKDGKKAGLLFGLIFRLFVSLMKNSLGRELEYRLNFYRVLKFHEVPS